MLRACSLRSTPATVRPGTVIRPSPAVPHRRAVSSNQSGSPSGDASSVKPGGRKIPLPGVNPTRERQEAAMPSPAKLQQLLREQQKQSGGDEEGEVYTNPATGYARRGGEQGRRAR